LNVKLLNKKYRGRGDLGEEVEKELLNYGQTYIHKEIEGADLLDNSGSEIPIYMDRYYYKEICLIEL
jgi:hypothetical protein